MEKIAAFLKKTNRWWKTGKLEPAFLYRTVRNEFNHIVRALNSQRILAVIGPRRVGKSTLLFQTIDYLLKQGVKSDHILFFSGDEPAIFNGDTNPGDVINSYEAEILRENLIDVSEKVYVLIDEIHVIKDWQLWLKSFFDRKIKIKFIISGSSSTHLFQGSKESLMGRIEEIRVMPLTFKQFAGFYSVYKNTNSAQEFFEKMPQQSFFECPEEYAMELLKGKFDYDEFKIQMMKILKEYLLVGGYPEYFNESVVMLWQKRLIEDIITRGLYRDIVSIYSIKNPEILERLLYFIADNDGQAHSFSTLAQTLGVDFSTVSSYINYLSNAFLVNVQENYSTNIAKIIRKNKKLYITDNGIRNALLRLDDIAAEDEGQLVENSSVRTVRAFCEERLYNLNYWKDNNKEVDIIIDKKTDTLPIEVKYRNSISGKDMRGIKGFIEKFDSKNGVLITKDLLKVENNITFMPFWLIN